MFGIFDRRKREGKKNQKRGMQMCIIDGWRRLALQTGVWDRLCERLSVHLWFIYPVLGLCRPDSDLSNLTLVSGNSDSFLWVTLRSITSCKWLLMCHCHTFTLQIGIIVDSACIISLIEESTGRGNARFSQFSPPADFTPLSNLKLATRQPI